MESIASVTAGAHRGIVIRMKNKVMRFPQPRRRATEVSSDDAMILFSLGDRRFAIQWIVTELSAKPAEVISMQQQRRRKKRPAGLRSERSAAPA
jgi:hypothetical protein